MRLEHGEHNEELCDHLLETTGDRFSDWVVTTAFYACIHFVEHKMFPLKMGGAEFRNFGEYCNHLHKKGGRRSKHAIKADLVRKNLPEVAVHYHKLKDACMDARYIDYRVSDEDAVLSRRAMKEVKKACLK